MTTGTLAGAVDPLRWIDGAGGGLAPDAERAAAAHPGRGLLVQEAGGAIVAANEAAATLMGLDWNQLVGRTTRDPRWAAVTEHGLSVTGDQHPAMRSLATGLPVRGFLMGVTIPGGSVAGAYDDRTRWFDMATQPLHRRPAGAAASARSFSEHPVAPPAAVLVAFSDVSDTPRGRAATETLLASYRLLAQMATDVILRTDANGVVGWLSDSVRRVLRIDPGQVIGQPMVLWLHPEDVDAVAALDTIAARRDGLAEPVEFECRWRTGGRSFRWMSAQARPVRDRRGDVVGAIIGLRDINEQVIARQSLASSERRYRLLAENATDAVYLVSSAGVIQWASPAVSRVLGFDPKDLVGTPAASRMHPESLAALRAVQSRIDRGETGVAVELRVRTAAGDYRWVSSVSGPALDDEGHVVGRIAALRDIHDEVRARHALAHSERTFRLALDGSPQGMALIGLDGRFLLVNDALCRLTGHHRDWLLAHCESDLLHPDRRLADREIHDRLLARRAPAAYNIHDGTLLSAAGEDVQVVHSMGLVRDDDGRPLFFVSHYLDAPEARGARLRGTA
jgi:PAS domain S-box-containing protein